MIPILMRSPEFEYLGSGYFPPAVSCQSATDSAGAGRFCAISGYSLAVYSQYFCCVADSEAVVVSNVGLLCCHLSLSVVSFCRVT